MSAIKENTQLIGDWLKKRTEPFTTKEAFDAIDEIFDVKDASDSLRHLYQKGLVSRKRIDGGKFMYALADRAPEGYEMSAPVMASFNKKDHPIVDIKEIEITKTGKPRPKKEVIQNTKPLETVKLPEGFCLRLETPSGITITITA